MIDQLLGFLGHYVPEVISVLLMMSLLVAESAVKDEHAPRAKIHFFTQAVLTIILICLFGNLGEKPVHIFHNAVTIDPFSTLVKIIMVIGTMGAVFISHSSKDIYSNLKSEFSVMAVGVLIGGMLLASANNMLTLYLAIETLSILSYVMSSLKREDSTSAEAGMKYALYGGLSAGVALFGISHMYGALGSIQFLEMSSKVADLQGIQLVTVMMASVLFFVGIGYKISVFPFHMWTPDVYQGSPIPVTSFFAIVPKMAGLAALIRVSYVFFADGTVLSVSWVGLMMVVAALTMTVGNVTAIGQNSVKRLLAFSSIGHVGMMILGVVVLNDVGIRAILFYGITYLFMTLIAFYITSHLSDMYGSDGYDVFRGLIYKHPLMAVIMVGVLFSLAGLPPFSGFVAKFNIFNIIIEKKYYGIAIVAAINSVIALYYYLKLAKTVIFGQADGEERVLGFTASNQAVIVFLFIPVLFLGIFWEKVMTIAGNATIYIK
ncbi:NADH-quinone oxidoreductase subunit N [Peredibacter sp. HCB2-198]|uniref:NADH-quinone oxidoreductase subunit N n=1 Tax=Peredibacter sp. HCB2-198 TaxID=3383025 RepID=UPI0038B41C6A